LKVDVWQASADRRGNPGDLDAGPQQQGPRSAFAGLVGMDKTGAGELKADADRL
jgi:hypothetical protein